MGSITAGDADSYRIWLGTAGKQAENTVRRLCSRAKQFFRAALRQKLISENPFADMKRLAVGASSDERIKFIDRAKVGAVLAACPDDEWRAIFALARYGGLRCPSEIALLKWDHIDWAKGEIMVTCVKTKHHEGRDIRVIPFFPELKVILEAWRANAPADCEFVITRARSGKTNLRTQLERIIRAAKMKPWPKLFQNLRSSRETELMEDYPIQVVCAWMGNTPKVATKHYLQVTGEHFDKARSVKPGAA
jgi:integrase